MFRNGIEVLTQLGKSVVADFNEIRRAEAKYHKNTIPSNRLPLELVQKVGLQMMATIRLMQGLESAQVPLLPKVMSRLIRHMYGAEIHWKAKLAPGISIVHGNGLVISHSASVGPRCILFHNVTLGVGVDPETREVGAPCLDEDVHVGPGATLIGPIKVGARTKIMAGAVLTQTVPADSLVRPGETRVTTRHKATSEP
jgi:serine acetyltransferase